MVRRKRGRKKKQKLSNILSEIRDETLRTVSAVFFALLAILLILAGFDLAGIAGNVLYKGLSFIFGVGYVLLPIIFFALSYSFFRNRERGMGLPKFIGAGIFIIAGLGLVDLLLPEQGGILGNLVSTPLISLVDFYATLLILAGLLVISILIVVDTEFSINIPFFSRAEEDEYGDLEDEEYYDEDEEEPEEEIEEAPSKIEQIVNFTKNVVSSGEFIRGMSGEYSPPPISLLGKDYGKPGVGDIKANSNIIKRTLQNFGISVEMDEISVGPTVTRYALKPAEGVRISKIVSLQNNLELALAAHPVRIEAPIPGKSLVGIEVPNSSKATLGLASLIGSSDFMKSNKSLLVVLGRDITGLPHFANLSKMPHMLIAGATGAGKSVTINTLITSLLYRNSPNMLRFIMVDPKRVELTLYNSIPHLLTPVITDAKRAIMALKWAAREMERRYDILEAERVRDISSYHEKVVDPAKENGTNELPEPMPHIVIVVDELADIMQAYPRELESAIVRLAQMSRAVGIHLILSTQRPSVNVITGLIKANIPSRIALQVSSQVDSRTILDGGGAEKLLGAGDMLYLSGEMSKPIRIQGPFISEDEVKRLVSFIAKNNNEMGDNIDISGDDKSDALFSATLEDSGEEDDLYENAREVVVDAGKASTSYIQRKLRVGYSRAARLMDMLEDRGVIGPQNGSRPREILEGGEEEVEEDYEEDNKE